jgi:cytochrome c oxidase assembly protein subunit 11
MTFISFILGVRSFVLPSFSPLPKSFSGVLSSRLSSLSFSLLSFSFILLFFSLSFLSVPLYQLFCLSTGFGGFLSPSPILLPPILPASELPKDLSFLHLSLLSSVSPLLPTLLFFPATDSLLLPIGLPSLLFFFLLSPPNSDPLLVLATFSLLPSSFAPFISKIQCFCFDQLLILPGLSLQLPVLLFLSPDLLSLPATPSSLVSLSYSLLPFPF